MTAKVYIETSLPSFYYEVRTEPDMVARKEWTRQWWNAAREDYLLVTSVAVLDELSRGNFPAREDAIELLSSLPLIPVESAIAEIVQIYIQLRRVNAMLGLYVPMLVTPLELMGEQNGVES